MNTPARAALLLIAACTHPAPAQAAPRTPAPAQGLSADAAAHIFETAQLKKDRTTLNRMLSPSYVFVHASGKVGDRNDFLAAFSDPAETFVAFDIINRKLIPLGQNAAIIAAEATIHGLRNKTPFQQHFRYNDTYVKTHGTWQVIYTQVTAIPP